ncbi:MAG: polysaccharide deacetylase family protein [Terricaulis sp.]
MIAYAPPRDMLSKVRRAWTQNRCAAPARLRFYEPALSVCFDDFPASAAMIGAPLLERYGGRGTFFAAGALADAESASGRCYSARDLSRLRSIGHEIGCHTFSHRDGARGEVFATLQDIARNRDALAAMGCAPATSLAYPYGETSFALKRALPRRIACARGISPGLNRGRVDLAQLRAYPLFGDGGLVRAMHALRRTARTNSWMIAFTHDVCATPSPWGTRPEDLEALLVAARKHGVAILPVSTALARGRA